MFAQIKIMRRLGLIWLSVYQLCSLSDGFSQTSHVAMNRPQRDSQSIQAPVKSVALSLHFELPELGLTYERCLDHAKDLGASHVTLIVQAQMEEVSSSTIIFEGNESTSIDTLTEVIKLAKSKGLKVILFPILWIQNRAEGEWRGTLNPKDRDRWWSAYESWMISLATLGEHNQVEVLSIGSELSSMEEESGRWRAMIRRLRVSFSGALTYSANWDHFEQVSFWDLLDIIGMTAYYPLLEGDQPFRIHPSHSERVLKEMIDRWKMIRLSLTDWLERTYPDRMIFFTELGYPSQVGGAHKPWHYLQSNEVDLEVQRVAYEAFQIAWQGEQRLRGVNIWNIWGLGGPEDAWYTLRGKPASGEVKHLFQSLDASHLFGHKSGSARVKSR